MLATLQPALLVGRSVTIRSLALSAFLGVFCITAPAQMLELACFITAPAFPHATSLAVYPALFYLTKQIFFWLSDRDLALSYYIIL